MSPGSRVRASVAVVFLTRELVGDDNPHRTGDVLVSTYSRRDYTRGEGINDARSRRVVAGRPQEPLLLLLVFRILDVRGSVIDVRKANKTGRFDSYTTQSAGVRDDISEQQGFQQTTKSAGFAMMSSMSESNTFNKTYTIGVCLSGSLGAICFFFYFSFVFCAVVHTISSRLLFLST